MVAECFPAHGSCCDQEQEDVAGAQCFLPDKPGPPCRALAALPSSLLRALPREGLAQEENHFSRLACSGWPSFPTLSQQPQEADGGPAVQRSRLGALDLSEGPTTPVPQNGCLLAPKSTIFKDSSDCTSFVFIRPPA